VTHWENLAAASFPGHWSGVPSPKKHPEQAVSMEQFHASAQQLLSTQLPQPASAFESVPPHLGEVHKPSLLQTPAQELEHTQASTASYFCKPSTCCVVQVLMQVGSLQF
jgi:hypothetical protein